MPTWLVATAEGYLVTLPPEIADSIFRSAASVAANKNQEKSS